MKSAHVEQIKVATKSTSPTRNWLFSATQKHL